jgi:DNA-binding MarR family transcriptional regulator
MTAAGTDHPTLRGSLLYALWQAQTGAQRALELTLEPLDLTLGQYGTLVSLHADGPQSAAGLARQHGLRPQSIAAAIQDLERRALVSRKPHPDNRRILLNEITPAGRRVAAKAHRRVRALESALVVDLPPGRQGQLRRALEQVFERARR